MHVERKVEVLAPVSVELAEFHQVRRVLSDKNVYSGFTDRQYLVALLRLHSH